MILADTEEDLNVLITVLERWCQDFKIKVSIKKTKIVGPNSDSEWVLKDHQLKNETLREMTQLYENLGVLEFKTVMGTARNKAADVLKRMRSYHGLRNMQKFFLSDTISSFLAIWSNILLPSVLYGLDVGLDDLLDQNPKAVAPHFPGILLASHEIPFLPTHRDFFGDAYCGLPFTLPSSLRRSSLKRTDPPRKSSSPASQPSCATSTFRKRDSASPTLPQGGPPSQRRARMPSERKGLF